MRIRKPLPMGLVTIPLYGKPWEEKKLIHENARPPTLQTIRVLFLLVGVFHHRRQLAGPCRPGPKCQGLIDQFIDGYSQMYTCTMGGKIGSHGRIDDGWIDGHGRHGFHWFLAPLNTNSWQEKNRRHDSTSSRASAILTVGGCISLAVTDGYIGSSPLSGVGYLSPRPKVRRWRLVCQEKPEKGVIFFFSR